MKTHVKALAVTLLFISVFVMPAAPAASAREAAVLQFNTMVGLPATLTGTQSQVALRGISGGGLPWTLTSARGSLSASGHLKVSVTGLVLAAGPNAGSNPIAFFRALVSCVNSDGTFSNILTAPFPATTGSVASGGGDSEIETDVALPEPCIAPIVFVTSPTGAWFAATGN